MFDLICKQYIVWKWNVNQKWDLLDLWPRRQRTAHWFQNNFLTFENMIGPHFHRNCNIKFCRCFYKFYLFWSPFSKRTRSFIYKNSIPFTQGCCVTILLEIGSGVLMNLKKKLPINLSCFGSFVSLKKGIILHSVKSWIYLRRMLYVNFEWKCEKFATTTTTEGFDHGILKKVCVF